MENPAEARRDWDDPGRGDTLQFMLSLVLEGTCINMNSLEYYRTVAQHIRRHDPDLLARAENFAGAVRARYRSCREHAAITAMVPVVRDEDLGIQEALQSDCAICLRPLRGPRKLARLRPSSDSPLTCGHFFHAHCVAEWELGDQSLAPKSCPLCREPLGMTVRLWEDHESLRPRF